ncbi:MAG TPA: PadR family transcriptional regulator [Candidatus Lokiarchaeia archaeon]|nr:PadR family transcriptional regulator [Candidatus Lokiarchaeia archaeon]
MKSNEVRFAILKNLSMGPGHGYDLFTIFKEDFEIKNPSELYKIIRAMKEEGLVRVASVEEAGGREREILEITPSGFETYYQEMLKASKNFLDLISETAIRRLVEGVIRRLSEMDMDWIFNETESIFVNLAIPIERQLQLINQIMRHFKKEPAIYIQRSKSTNDEARFLKASPRIHFLDENMVIKPGTIDLVLLFGPILESIDDTSTTNIVQLLKPGGTLISATLQENLRQITPGLLAGVKNFFTDLLDEPVASKLLESFSQLLMSDLFFANFVPNAKIQEYLEANFENIKLIKPRAIQLAPIFDIFIAQKKTAQD